MDDATDEKPSLGRTARAAQSPMSVEQPADKAANMASGEAKTMSNERLKATDHARRIVVRLLLLPAKHEKPRVKWPKVGTREPGRRQSCHI